MEGLLTPVSTSYKHAPKDVEPALVEVIKPRRQAKPSFQASTPIEALEILKNEPDYDSLISTLKFLRQDSPDFNIVSPSPAASQLIHILVHDIIPNYWGLLRDLPQRKDSQHPNSDLNLFLSCLRSVPGLNAVLLALKQRIQQARDTKKTAGGPKVQEILSVLLQVLQALLQGTETVKTIWKDIYTSPEPTVRDNAIWQEFLGLCGGGKLLGTSAEAEDVINDLSKKVQEKHWIADGSLFSLWLAKNTSYWALSLPADSKTGFASCASFLSKAFRLGHTENFVKELMLSMILQQNEHIRFNRLLEHMPKLEQRNVLFSLVKIVSKDYLSSSLAIEDNSRWWQSDASMISAVAALIKLLVDGEESHKGHFIFWLTNSSGGGIGDGIAIRRAIVASLALDKVNMESILEKSLRQFGDQLYIRHTPTLQQEVHAQILLLSAGYMHRVTPLRLVMMMRSGAHLSVVSNRLASSSPRARFLGMVIGEALSSLVDTEDKKMDFKVEEMSTPEAKWYKSLVEVSDSIGTLDVLRPGKETERVSEPQARPPKLNRNPRGAPMGSKIMAIKEVETDEEEEIGSEDDGLPQYAKPDSDEEDSDEDATLITRNKPTAPVYIRDLITYLRDTENYDHQKLGLVTAAPLIRRKANYGTEVSAHAEEVATLLVGLQDKYDIENFQDMRLQGMIAVLIALPQKMGQWFAKTFFDGDYSLSQRASILTTLGLGAREIGGFGEDDVALSSAKHDSASSFPSRTLPAVMHKYYASSPAKPPLLKSFTNQSNQDDGNVISLLTTAISKTMIAPLVSSANKTLHGPALLQTRTFSTRQAVNAARKKPTTNALAQIVSTSFFFPLTGRLSLLLSSSRASAFPALSSPFLLSHLLKTLALLLHASGPNTLSLPQMTAEFWDLLLALRVRAHGDVAVMEGLLFCFLTILEINEDKYQLVEAQGRQLLETQEWVEGIFSRLGNSASGGVIQGLTGGGGQAVSEEDDKIRMLAAAVLVRLRECVEKYQALLMGDLASF